MNYIAKIQDKEFKINLEDRGDQVVVIINGTTIPIQLNEIDGSHVYSALVGNRSIEIEIRRNEVGYLIFHKGSTLEYLVEDERTARLKKSMSQSVSQKVAKDLKAPMPGLIAVQVSLQSLRLNLAWALLNLLQLFERRSDSLIFSIERFVHLPPGIPD